MSNADNGGNFTQLLQEEPTEEERYAHALEILAILNRASDNRGHSSQEESWKVEQ